MSLAHTYFRLFNATVCTVLSVTSYIVMYKNWTNANCTILSVNSMLRIKCYFIYL